MSIIYQENNANFTKISNALIIDTSISAGAKVLYCYLRSKPNNWKVINAEIMKTLQISKETIAKYFKELIASGWIVRKRETNQSNQFSGGFDYIINETQTFTELGKEPNSEKCRIRENIENINKTNNTNKTDLLNKTDLTNLLPTTKIGEIKDEIYNLFKDIYKKHTGNEYLAKNHEFVNLVKTLKQFSKENVINKIYLFETMCENKKEYFTKRGFADFTLGKLISHWNEIVEQTDTANEFLRLGQEEQ